MTELLPIISPDHKRRPEEVEREFWDGAISALAELAAMAENVKTAEFDGSADFDLDYELTEMAKEDEETARDQLVGFAAMLTVPADTTSELEDAWEILIKYGVIEPDEEIE